MLRQALFWGRGRGKKGRAPAWHLIESATVLARLTQQAGTTLQKGRPTLLRLSPHSSRKSIPDLKDIASCGTVPNRLRASGRHLAEVDALLPRLGLGPAECFESPAAAAVPHASRARHHCSRRPRGRRAVPAALVMWVQLSCLRPRRYL